VLCCWQIAVRQTLFVRAHFSAYFTESSITFSLHSLKYKLGNMGKNLIKNQENTIVPLHALLAYRFFSYHAQNRAIIYNSCFGLHLIRKLPSLFKVKDLFSVQEK